MRENGWIQSWRQKKNKGARLSSFVDPYASPYNKSMSEDLIPKFILEIPLIVERILEVAELSDSVSASTSHCDVEEETSFSEYLFLRPQSKYLPKCSK